jgi:hypothetical protein
MGCHSPSVWKLLRVVSTWESLEYFGTISAATPSLKIRPGGIGKRSARFLVSGFET